jgi:lipopolysaccharide export system protein LptA
MNSKTLVQLLLLAILSISAFFIFKNFYVKDEAIVDNQKTTNTTEIASESQNIIENIKYTSNNIRGDIFEILADYGESNLEDPDQMFLTKVTGNIIFKDNSNIKLISDNANFNTKSFETTFLGNVKISRLDEVITGEQLYFVLELDEEDKQNNPKKEENLIKMSNNVIFKKPGYKIKADVLEIDLITKNSIIYMYNKDNKVIANTILKQ